MLHKWLSSTLDDRLMDHFTALLIRWLATLISSIAMKIKSELRTVRINAIQEAINFEHPLLDFAKVCRAGADQVGLVRLDAAGATGKKDGKHGDCPVLPRRLPSAWYG